MGGNRGDRRRRRSYDSARQKEIKTGSMALSHTSFAFLIKMISRFTDTLFAVFNGFRRAEADTRRTVGAILAPNGFAVF